MNYNVLETNIYIYHNMLNNDFIAKEKIVEWIDSTNYLCNEDSLISPWKQWKTNDGYIFGEQKTLKHGNIEKNDSMESKIYFLIKNSLKSAANHYKEDKKIEIGGMSPIPINKYYTEKEMGSHVDNYNNDPNPTISALLYLNDDYVGGDLYFKEQYINIKPKIGDIVIFPSREPYFHQSKIVTSGTKYMSAIFFNKKYEKE